ncbi:MAG: DUF1643 domain-containing protein [Desulfobaccales bacterium]
MIPKQLPDGNWELHSDLKGYIDSGAIFSQQDWKNAIYRYNLWRVWDWCRPRLLFILLNSSRGSHFKLTKTSDYCDGIAKRGLKLKGKLNEFGSVEVVNLFAFITSKSDKLKSQILDREINYVIGPQNDNQIGEALKRAYLVVVAWGCDPFYKSRYISVLHMINDMGHKPYSLYKNKDNLPYHPYGILRNRKELLLFSEDQFEFIERYFDEYVYNNNKDSY